MSIKAVYLALAVLPDGSRDILGIWIEQTEGAKFWMKVFSDLKTRGCQDIRIAEGIFDPHLVPALSYQRATNVTVSTVGGGTNGALRTNQVAGSLEYSGRTPWLGGSFAANLLRIPGRTCA